ncbi:telomere length regulator protein (Rif1) [Cordyceps fumosorosea ARSEF 2679]|uniref:Telomere length regulator protein (Rif1) n=1 Tax=Cordyceps fumosorosea (strain ARSEF 2679) TaxID=1081104 RepID=A0A167NYD3_CORFA|nr:telomere length regulator protein (Rif1) [Cordyceps fumosorosea ARSEF 2679]OAA56082.1 telomere length regulator protein (Rif1) [Cordyceps fumosorosea ARSEF 2679]
MASLVDTPAATLFTSLPARPPTPPRETNHARDAATGPSTRPQPCDHRLNLHTPPNAGSAASAAAQSNTGSTRTRKRVEWSSHTQYKEPADYSDASRPPKPSPTASATPSSASRPIKGILKPSSSSSPLITSLNGDGNGDASQGNMIDMLDSTIKQLAGSDRDSKLDAYMVLARVLKASNNLPDRVALQEKMSLFMQFIQRDITVKNGNATPDTSLINHALTLVATFLHFPAIASTLTSDFGIFIIDHAIRSFEDASKLKKDVVRHLMQVVALQTFPPKVMTSDRVGRLVASLHMIETHVTGKSIIMSRIQIYRRLIKQAPKHMTIYSDWLQDMFTDMLSSIKEIRSQAIGLGNEAGFSLRSEKPLTRRATEIMQATSEGEAYMSFYISRLNEMIKDRQTSSAVPQIWSVVILFLKCPLERWQYYAPWLTLVQLAFNMTDSLTKQEANYAWNRYVYLSLTENKLSPKVLATLCQPLMSQLRRKSSPKQLEEASKLKRTVLGGVCSLYYYTFAPGNQTYSADTVWDITVQPIMSLLLSLDDSPEIPGDCVMQASHILVGLLDVATPRVWRHDRIMDLPPVKADELPPIDSKWVRKNCEKVLQPVSAILEKKFLDLANKESLAYRLWHVLVGSIASASAKDIKVSEDTAKFIACTFSFIAKVWSTGVTSADETNTAKFFTAMGNFIAVLVQGLRVLPFMEKKLSMTSNKFEPILTPSRHNDQPESTQGVSRIPVLHLLHMFASLPPGAKDDEAFSTFFSAVSEPFFKDRPRKNRLELARELLHQLPRNSTTPFAPWLLASQSLSLLLGDSSDIPAPTSSSSEQLLGPVYREFVSLLDRGLMLHPNLPLLQWSSVFTKVCEHARCQAGDAGLALAVVEPLAKALADSVLPNANAIQLQQLTMAIQASSALFEVAYIPRDAHAVEAARRRLWGTALTTAKGNSADPYGHLYKLGNSCLSSLYSGNKDTVRNEDIILFLQSVAGFLGRSGAHGLKLLNKLQSGICVWILDEDLRLAGEGSESVCKAVETLWDQSCAILTRNGSLSKAQFDDAEVLFTTAFKSKQKCIVKKAADTWNIVVKDEESVDCSESLKSVVSSLRLKLDIVLPGSEADGFGAQSGRGRDDISFVALSSMSSHQDGQQEPNSTAESATPSLQGRASTKRNAELPPEHARSKRSKPSATPKRLRHDNSQITFAPIVSSPVVEESQHLTERQKEVRERQRGEHDIYSEQRKPSTSASGGEKEASTAKASARSKQKGTPQREAKYGKHITSTPTPRRGQVLQLDDLNDPPSSPPLPRPCPLLSELKPRSRAGNALENWEFSSPPGSPVINQTGSTEAENAEPTALSELQQPAAGMVTRSRHRRSHGPDEPVKIIPSSLDMEKVNDDAQPQAKERKKSIPRKTRSRTSIDPAAQPPREPAVEALEVEQAQKEAKVVEAASSKGAAEVGKTSRRRKSLRGKAAAAEQPRDSELPISIPSSAPEDTGVAPSSSVLPFTPAGKVEIGKAGGSEKGKRKRSGLSSVGNTPKKRCSQEREPEPVTESTHGATVRERDVPTAEDDSEESQSLPELKRTEDTIAKDAKSPGLQNQRAEKRNRSRRKGKQKRNSTVARRHKENVDTNDSTVGGRRKEGADTDEEVMSQLVTEARAATASEAKAEADEVEAALPQEVPSGNPGEVDEPAPAEAPKPSFMDTLRQGLDQLRSTTLSRDEVYKMEEMLMDMKREIYEAEFRGRNRQ